MEIKGPSGPKPPLVPPTTDRIGDRPAAKFPGGRMAAEQAVNAAPTSGPTSVLAEFRRADLRDPAKVDRMVQRSAEELVQSQPGTANLAPDQRQQIVGWMEKDPILRGKILNYLERTLQ